MVKIKKISNTTSTSAISPRRWCCWILVLSSSTTQDLTVALSHHASSLSTSSRSLSSAVPSMIFPRIINNNKSSRLDMTATNKRSQRSGWTQDDDDNNNNSSGNSNPFLEDKKGHINPELAQRLWKWEQEQRLHLNLPEFEHSRHSTIRQGLRWVQQLVTELLKEDYNHPADWYNDRSEDMIQEGVIALMQAMTQYEKDARPNETFEMFAQYRIRRALEDLLLSKQTTTTTSGSSTKSNTSSNTNNSNKTPSTPASRRNTQQQRPPLSMESTVEISDPLETHYSNQDEWEAREGLVGDAGNMIRGKKTVEEKPLVEDYLDESLQYEGEDQMWVHQQQVAAPLRDMIPESSEDTSQSLFFENHREPTPDDLILHDMIRFNIDQFLRTTGLTEEEAQVIQMRFGLEDDEDENTSKKKLSSGDSFVHGVPKTQKEVAYELGFSVSKVRKLQKSALEKLREAYAKRYIGVDEDNDSAQDDDYYFGDGYDSV